MPRSTIVKTKYLLSLTFVLLFLLASLTPRARAATLTVCASGCTYTSIQAAINAAVNGDIIDVGNGTYTETYITVSKNLTIQGHGASNTIVQAAISRGTATSRVFMVNASLTVTFKDMTIRYGRDPSEGGGIYVYTGSSVTVINSTVSDNDAGYGGGLFVLTGAVTVTNSTLSGNTARRGGGIFAVGMGNVTVTNSSLISNTATDKGGGILNNGGSTTIISSTLRGNTGGNTGGGLVSIEGTVKIISSTFTSNSTNSDCGGLCVDNGVASINTSTFSRNTAYRGGGLFVHSGMVTVTNSTLISNTATGDGGGIFIFSGGANVTVTNSSLISNTARQGGGICVHGGVTNLTNSSLISNTASGGGGGGIYVDGGVANLTNSSLISNTASASGGGGIYVSSGVANLTNSSLISNTASTDGGGIDLGQGAGAVNLTSTTFISNTAYHGGGLWTIGTANVTNSTFSGNTAQWGGGLFTGGGTANVIQSTISGNSASRTGGGIYNNGGANVKNSIVALQASGGDCNASVTSQGYNLESGTSCGFTQTGDLQNTDPRLDPPFDNGGPTATRALLTGSPAIGKIPTGINGCGTAPLNQDQRGMTRPQNNTCDIGAFQTPLGGLLIVTTVSDEYGENASQCSLREAIEAANTDRVFGGCFPGVGADTISLPAGLYVLTRSGTGDDRNIRGDLDIDNVLTITGESMSNTFIDGNQLDRVLHIVGGTVQISGVTVKNGRESVGGGAGLYIGASARVTIITTTFTDNKANMGGGITSIGMLTLRNTTFFSNTAKDGSGGGLFVFNGTTTINNSTFSGNIASIDGGGLFVGANGTANVTNSTLSGNTATSGGAINNNGRVNVWFTTLAWNSTTSNQGAHIANSGVITLSAAVLAQAQGGDSCSGTAPVSGGYNRISDVSCLSTSGTDIVNAAIALKPLAYNKGATLNHLPVLSEDNQVIDVVPQATCEQWLGVNPTDQRGQPRPRKMYDNNYCDAGSVELVNMTRFVCGPPLSAAATPKRCEFPSIGAALADAMDSDIIVVSGIITETVTVTRNVIIRGPSIDESTPGTHLGIVQGALTTPGSPISPVFTIPAGQQVTLQNLNIRNGYAVSGSAINNAGALTLQGMTLYANNTGAAGSVILNDATGTLVITNSTLTDNTGTGALISASANIAGAVKVQASTLVGSGSKLLNNTAALGTALRVADTILTGTVSSQCANVTSDGGNLYGDCFTPAPTDKRGDPGLGPLRDNGGPTLSRGIGADSPAIGAASCGAALDQRGRARPAANCASGAVEYAPQTLTVCAACDADPANRRYNDLQQALNQAMTGDTLALEAGAYTGNFITYKDVTLQHAGLDVSTLSRERPVEVRALLQASDQTIAEQHRLNKYAGTVLTVQSYTPVSTTITPGGDVTVTVRGLTIRHGASQKGGGIYNLGTVSVFTSTVAENAAYNGAGIAMGGGIYNAGRMTLERSTVSGNQSEFYGGALYNAGPSYQAGGSPTVVNITASTIADNRASRLPDQRVVAVTDGGLSPTTLTVQSGDEIRFENRTANGHTLNITVGAGGACQSSQIAVPVMGAGLSPALICTRSGVSGSALVTVTDSLNGNLSLQVTVQAVTFTPVAHAIYRTGNSQVSMARSILFSSVGSGQNCDRPGSDIYAVMNSGGYNLVSDDSCFSAPQPTDKVVNQAEVNRLGPLQDNNTIDFAGNRISGYTYSHVPSPGSAAIDQIPPQSCGLAAVHSIALQGSLDLTIGAGEIVQWANSQTYSITLAFHDSESAVQFVQVPGTSGAGQSRQVQFNAPGGQPYTVYHAATRQAVGSGTITVSSAARLTDQRGTLLPQRGPLGQYSCDIGADEFAPWIVGQPLPRPPSAIGTQPPGWAVNGASVENLGYHAWSPATALDYALRPSRAVQQVTVKWNQSMDPATTIDLPQLGVVEWPDAPQIHISTAPVDVGHNQITDGYLASGARAFEGTEPAEDAAGTLLSQAVFTRTELTALPGDSYSVLQLVKGNQASAMLKVLVVKTVDWNTAGARDITPARTACTIGATLNYPLHQDPEGRPGWILSGNAYDGVRTSAEQAVTSNTVGNAIPPAHIRETRTGPIIPILAAAPTAFTNTDPATGDHDLRIAWYMPDDRRVAWPVKSVGYRCDWPQNAPQIVIASELGSEIGGQPVLNSDHFVNPAVYHQTDAGQPGFSPNYEHALLAASNLGNTAPALYALRTELFDRDAAPSANRSFALLKYQDALDDNQAKMAVYQVVLTRAATVISPGAVTPRTGSGAPSAAVGQRFTVPVELLGAQNLRTATVRVAYDPAALTPAACTPNSQVWMERPMSLTLASDAPAQPGAVMHLRANLVAGTDVSYQWNFSDGLVQIDTASVSHVYGAAGNYTVIVTASNSLFSQVVTASGPVAVALGAIPGSLPAASPTGCRIGPDGVLTLEVMTRSKHGQSGDLILAEVAFTRTTAAAIILTPTVVSLTGPGYETLSYDLTAGNPVYAPTPMRGLLDTQPCTQTQAADMTALPFWKDYRDMLWARAAGDMQVLYFYPLQTGFYLSDDQAVELGLTDPTTGQALSQEKRVGKCVPWLNNLATGTLLYPDFPHTGDTTRVLPVAYHVSWPALPPLLSVGETVYQRAKSGISGVATQMAVSRIYDDLAPGVWDNTAKKIVLGGAQVITALTQLIAPTDEVRVPLTLKNDDGNFSLPDDIKTERRLYGGGLAIAGNKKDINLALPFSLRSRVSYDDGTGELVFRGYYDGASSEYIKGDPLLLLNVMSKSDQARLKALCPTANANCTAYQAAIDALYWATLNPRQLDLCRDASGRLFADDPERDTSQLAKTSSMTTCANGTYYRDGQPDHAFLIGVQDAADDGVPEPYEGLGKGKALTAGNAAGTGYVTLVYNNDDSLGGLPVSLQVVKVGCEKNAQGDDSTYRGNLLVIKSDNLFDEKLTLRHTGDFGGRPDNFTFDWYIAAVDDTGVSPAALPPNYPWKQWTRIEPGANTLGSEITIEGAAPTTLSDNWLIMRYKGYAACGNAYRYSAFAGDPSAKPSEVKAQLAEGWIKRVTNALNPLDARVDDFVSSPVNTTVSMIQQAGPRYEGPVAMSSDPDTLNAMGLIEAYQTVLNRGRALSIDSNINDQGANAALLNVTSRIADLYMLLANDAYADALDPTVGLGTTSSLGSRAPVVFAFMNQFPATQFGLIDEELALLRGRDQTLGGVAAAPTYNRLTWNFTHGDGAVAYQQNYNVKDVNTDGFINEADAALMYPQGHGDAWGQFLTAITKYYELLRHPSYTWVPRAEPVAVAGAPVVVDYYDERRFAIAAANKARIGAEIVDLAYRKNYADPASQAYLDTLIDTTDTCTQQAPADCQQRAWGVADWADRAGEGAFFDWVVANAILPPVDDRYSDLRKIDRTTVAEIGEIAAEHTDIQTKLDNADKGANPLGLAPNAVLFDLDPALTKTTPSQEGQTHFEQVYDRAATSLGNAVTLFNYANEMKIALRDGQNEQQDFAHQVVDEDRALVNELIDLFGTPYADDIGVNGTYPAGYEGPDIYNYDLTDRTTMTDMEKRCTPDEIKDGHCSKETKTYTIQYKALNCIGKYVTYLTLSEVLDPNSLCGQTIMEAVGIEYIVGTGLDAGYGRFTPATWSGARRVSGEIANKLGAVYAARANYELAVTQYQNLVDAIVLAEKGIDDRAGVLQSEHNIQSYYQITANIIRGIVLGLKEVAMIMNQSDKEARALSNAAQECLPKVVGLASDVTSVGRCGLLFAGYSVAGIMTGWEIAAAVAGDLSEFGLTLGDDIVQLKMFDAEADYELRQMGRDFQDLLRQEKELRIQVLLAQDEWGGAQTDYLNAVQLGFRKLKELSATRQRWAGQVSEQRYGDMAYRTFQIDALQKYRQQFDMAQLYTFLAASAYDYETNLSGSDPANGDKFVRQIAELRSLGELRVAADASVVPIAGSHGLADPLARMKANMDVLKGQMGFNNPQSEANRFSLRHELLRLRDTSDAKWRQELQKYYTPDIYSNNDVASLAKRPYGETGPVPGLVIPFNTTIRDKLNFFGLPLGPGDSAYDASQFSTKIASAGIWFQGYDTARLANTPRVYLLPAGKDVIRPRNTSGQLRYWNITEQLLPLPYPITSDDLQDPDWIARVDGLNGQLFASKPYARLRAYPYSDDLSADELNTDTRLIGRSVWNTEWILVIPGTTLLADPGVGIERFIQDVDDIYIYFQTYSYAGTR